MRVRKYYEHYYMKKSAPNEDDILEQLTLGWGMTRLVLLQGSLGLFPLFTLMGVGFQCAVYPPPRRSRAPIKTRSSSAASLQRTTTLRKGTVDVLAGGARTEVLYRVNQGQYFGEEVLTGKGGTLSGVQQLHGAVVSRHEDLLGCAAWARPRGLVPSHAK